MKQSIFKTFAAACIALALCFICLPAAAQFVTATISVTNVPNDGDTVILNSITRTFKTTVITPSSQILIGSGTNQTATNLFQQLAANPIAGTHLAFVSPGAITLEGITLTATKTGAWGVIALATATTTNLSTLMLPASSMPDQSSATNLASLTATAISDYSTNSIRTNAPAMKFFVDLFNAQSLSNKILFLASIYSGTVSNTSITNSLMVSSVGDFSQTINGGNQRVFNFFSDDIAPATFNYWTNGVLLSSFQMNSDGTVAAYNASGESMFTFDQNKNFTGYGANNTLPNQTTNAVNSILTSVLANNRYALLTNGFSVGQAATNFTTSGTNVLAGILTRPRWNNTTLANSNNVINPGTNSYIKVSGPSGSFAISSITGGVDGRVLTIENATGQIMVVENDNGFDGTPANRILTGTGSDTNVVNNPGSFSVIYDSAASRWIITTQTK